jgi:hypothetical protein
MSLQLSVPEAYFFDYLSILQVKLSKKGGFDNITAVNGCRADGERQLGGVLFQEILDSKEYAELYDANRILFDLVDLAKSNKVTAKEVDDYVYVRFLKKKALQEKFFPTIQYGEKKYGYKEGNK